MATIVKEDGTGTNPAANSYADEADLQTYLDDRGLTVTKTLDILLITAMDYLEIQNYKGTKLLEDQPLAWPRDEEGVPDDIVKAQLVAAYQSDTADLLSPTGQALKKEMYGRGAVELEYQDNTSSTTSYQAIDRLLNPYLISAYGSANFAVTRA